MIIEQALDQPFPLVSAPVENGFDHDAEINQESQIITPEKIHIRGVDDLTTGDIIAFAAEHFQFETPTRIEWIDDTSANIIFSNSDVTSNALNHFSIDNMASVLFSPSQLRAAKTFSKHPELRLELRIAFSTDQKKPRAHEASRFYMMHPEHDPREKRRHETGSRDHDFKRRRYDRKEHWHRKELDDHDGFGPEMYDDDCTSNKGGSRCGSYSNHSFSSDGLNADGGVQRRRRRGDFYRPRKMSESGRASRDRSASPDQASGVRNVRRRTPSRAYRSHRLDPPPASNSGKELFPVRDIPITNRILEGKELFPNKTSASILKKELFPNKVVISNHRRSDAFDAADETAELFASGLTVSNSTPVSARSSFITKLTASAPKDGRLQNPETGFRSLLREEDENNELNIRGASKLESLGMSIRGAAGDGTRMRKSGNAGKELFVEKLKRNKAADMFY